VALVGRVDRACVDRFARASGRVKLIADRLFALFLFGELPVDVVGALQFGGARTNKFAFRIGRISGVVRLFKRTAIALAVVVIGLILWTFGVTAGAWVAGAGLVAAFLVNLLAPWPWNM
jgi:hypothetical protein